MKKTAYLSLMALVMAFCSIFTACSDFEPTGYTEVASLAKASDLKATVDGFKVNLSWSLPDAEGMEGVLLLRNADASNPTRLDLGTTSYTVEGQPMAEETLYTVKILYSDNRISEGVSVKAEIPMVELPGVSNLRSEVSGRTVKLSWTLPGHTGITGVSIVRNGDTAAATHIEGAVTSAELKAQPMGGELTYTVSVVYDKYYESAGVDTKALVPVITPKMCYLLTAASADRLPDDDERAAAAWFGRQPNAEFIQPSQIADLDADIYSVIWIEIDRKGLAPGWQNLPSEITDESTIAALKSYTAKGGSLYLSNMATQLTAPLGIVPDNMAPTVFSSGDGGSGGDVWTINPKLGWDFRDGGDQGFYDRTYHEIFAGLTMEDPNGYGYDSLPLIGPGQREDHNCLWDCNIYGKGSYPDVIRNFEVTTSSQVLATWGHVRDHCVAGLVDFHATSTHGRCVANGFAAYEWNQNSGSNPYQGNIEKLTENILNYLK